MPLKKLATTYGLAALAGIFISLGFAPANLHAAAWLGPGLMLFCAAGQPRRRQFALGFTAGFVFFLSSLYWLLFMPLTWLGIPFVPALGWVALSAYSALYFGAWVWFCWRCAPTEPWKRMAWAFFCAVAWTALEFMRGRFLGGFPWNFLGTSQYQILPVIQIASYTGVFGVSFLMVWFSVALAQSFLNLVKRPGARLWAEMALPLLALAGTVAFGMSHLMERPAPGRALKVAMIQPNFQQTLIWDPEEDARRFEKVMQLSSNALTNKPDLLVWPESAVPNLDPDQQHEVGQLLGRANAWLLFCEDSGELTRDGATNYFNACFLVSPGEGVAAIYHKRRLVIFGEYIPLVHWLPFLKWLAPIGPGFTPGDRIVPFDLTRPEAHVSPLICFEDSFPEEAREHSATNTDLLINLTNDGWFGVGAEQWQQAASAVFRCVENGLPMLRCCNNGLTCQIDSQGRLTVMRDENGSVYGRGTMVVNEPLQARTGRPLTFYNFYGDLFAWCCGMASVGVLIWPSRTLVSRRTVSKI